MPPLKRRVPATWAAVLPWWRMRYANWQSVRRVSKGEALTAEMQDAIARIQHTIGEVSLSASEIADALAEQRTASNDMARRVEQIAQLSENNADSAVNLDNYADQLEDKA